jgi:hypothetical protein
LPKLMSNLPNNQSQADSEGFVSMPIMLMKPLTKMWLGRFGLSMMMMAILVSAGICCSIPVFRYALEHWSPEPFLVHIVSNSQLNESEQQLIKHLEEQSSIANIRVKKHLGESSDSILRKLGATAAESTRSVNADPSTTWLIVEDVRRSAAGLSYVWKAPFTASSVQQLLTSPTRTKIAEGLANGESVVWVFLDSGNPEKDSSKFAKLQSELRRLERVIELPVIDPADLKDAGKEPLALTLRFAVHRISRESVDENAFISMLLATESDLRDEYEQGAPMAFPIFGRGRVLYALLGEGIATGTIEEACRFLAGACQCTVKQENPGADLVFAFDWASHIQITSPSKEASLGDPNAPPLQVPIPKGSNKASTEASTDVAPPINAIEVRNDSSSQDANAGGVNVAVLAVLGVAIAGGMWMLSKFILGNRFQ